MPRGLIQAPFLSNAYFSRCRAWDDNRGYDLRHVVDRLQRVEESITGRWKTRRTIRLATRNMEKSRVSSYKICNASESESLKHLSH